MTPRHQQTDVHESLTKQDRININDPQVKVNRTLGFVKRNVRTKYQSITELAYKIRKTARIRN